MKHTHAYTPRNTNLKDTEQIIKTGNLTTYHASNTKTKQPKLTNKVLKQNNTKENKQKTKKIKRQSLNFFLNTKNSFRALI